MFRETMRSLERPLSACRGKVYPLMRLHRVPAIAAGVLALAAVTACAENSPTTTPTQPVTTPSATATSDTEVARAAATNTVHDYFAVLDDLRQDHGQSIHELTKVATSTQLTAAQRLVENERAKKLKQIGDLRLAETSVENISLDNSDPKAGKVPTVTIDVCWDVRDVDVVDAAGTSVVSPDRADFGWTRFIVANYHYQTDPATGWRVASGEDLKQPPCDS